MIYVFCINDIFFLIRRAWDFGEILLQNKKYRPDVNEKANFEWNRIITGGWNTAYSAQVYAEIGGYDPTMRQGEDMYIGKQISILRGNIGANGRVA